MGTCACTLTHTQARAYSHAHPFTHIVFDARTLSLHTHAPRSLRPMSAAPQRPAAIAPRSSGASLPGAAEGGSGAHRACAERGPAPPRSQRLTSPRWNYRILARDAHVETGVRALCKKYDTSCFCAWEGVPSNQESCGGGWPAPVRFQQALEQRRNGKPPVPHPCRPRCDALRRGCSRDLAPPVDKPPNASGMLVCKQLVARREGGHACRESGFVPPEERFPASRTGRACVVHMQTQPPPR